MIIYATLAIFYYLPARQNSYIVSTYFFNCSLFAEQLEFLGVIEKKESLPKQENSLECPEQDSNLHTETGTTPSKWRVYQFHHLGETANIVAFL